MTPVERFLADPDRVTGDLPRRLVELVAGIDGDRIAAIVGVAVVVAAARGALRSWRHRRLATGARVVVIQPPPDVDPTGAEALWTTLHDLLHPTWKRLVYGQPHVGFEYQWTAAGMTIRLWVPGPVPPGLVERAVEAAWPAAHTTTTTPAADPVPAGPRAVVAGELRLAAAEWFPLRTDHDTDPLRALIGAATSQRDDDVVCVQVLARPVTGRRVARAHRAARAVHTGRPATTTARLLDLAAPTPRVRPSDDPARTTDVRAILDKASQPGWEIVVRYTTATTDPTRDRRRLRGRAHAVAAAFAVYTGRNRFARRRLHHPAATITSRRLGRGDLVGVPELAAVAHLPTDATVAGLTRAGARSVAPPPTVGRVGKVLGDSDTGPPRPVALAVADARHHVHVIGATGSGKSTLLANVALDDVAAGRGVVVVDPKGDLVTDILDRIPATAADRVVLLDPDETVAPPALNLLDGADPDVAVDHLVGIFRRIYAHYWGPRTDDILRSACLTLLRRPPATLADVPRLLSDPRFRRPYLDGIADPVGLGGFWAWYTELSAAQQAQVIGPVMNKLRAFLLRGFARATVSTTSSFSMADVLDRGGVCLARLPKGVLGDDTARLLGSFVVARAWHAATARAHRPEHARRDAALYIDECHNFLTLPGSVADMLAEARGYHLSLVLAHQHLGQLPRELRDAIATNARTKLWFTTAPDDARTLERHVAPELSAHDLAHLGAYQAAARVVADGTDQPACTLTTRPLPTAIAGRADAVRSASRRRFGRSVSDRRRHARARDRRSRDPRPTRGGAGTSDGRPAGRSPGSLRPADPNTTEPAGHGDTRSADDPRDCRRHL